MSHLLGNVFTLLPGHVLALLVRNISTMIMMTNSNMSNDSDDKALHISNPTMAWTLGS